MSKSINAVDKEKALKIVTKRGILIKDLPDWQDDKDVALTAVKSFPFALEHISERLKKDRDVVIAAIKKEPRIISLAAKEIYDDDEFRAIAFLTNKSAFIVDPEACDEFAYQDAVMMSKVYRSTLIVDENGKRSWDKTKYEKGLKKNEFFKKFKRYYRPEKSKITALEIREFEKELLSLRKARLEKLKEKDSEQISTLG